MQTESFLPLLMISAALFLFSARLRTAALGDQIVLVGLAVVILRYLSWRIFDTVLPAQLLSIEGIFVWSIFIIEFLTWIDVAILYAFMLRRTNRTPEADLHEARLRAMDPYDLPEVDVFIATYDEPAKVLEKTIVGASAMDWPRSRINIWVLDDGRREWLRDLCHRLEVGYLTRADNAHAKAGNINAAVARTSAPYFLVLDADFIPLRNFLYRAMGFFQDPRIGIVQIPHNFFNPDPMQASLNMSKVIPDDQRFFFEAVMPGRDGYDCAFCCGSNGVVRRSALEEIGNALPSGSITEDMLLTLAFLRKGYITRFLDERLALGMAPENINAFFIQRARWVRGAIQIMFLREGPFGAPGLTWYQRLFFVPLHWITQSLGQTMAMVTPVIFMLANIPPLVNATADTVISYQFPAIVAAIAALRHFAPGEFHPLATMAHSVLQGFRLLPVVIATLIKPHGHAFKVTPKGLGGGEVHDSPTVILCLVLCLLMTLGLAINANFNTQIVVASHLMPVVAIWSILNMVVLLLVTKLAITPPMLRSEERFEMTEAVVLHLEDAQEAADTVDMSLNGIQVKILYSPYNAPKPGDWIGIAINDVGVVPGRVLRVVAEGRGLRLFINFELPDAVPVARDAASETEPETDQLGALDRIRQRLIRKLYTEERERKFEDHTGVSIGLTMLRGIVSAERTDVTRRNAQSPDTAPPVIPAWLKSLEAQSEESLDHAWREKLHVDEQTTGGEPETYPKTYDNTG
ncbi:glycosyltransferase family 2 protein [Tritonibacter horizontis]|uniref:Cellulose synthase catalytic subunit n=1 Tax=Tritonibacter horizontis TaxID=1768241 RepID=A0A132BV77_9RHOB|nr:glycosyltransferase family 2 protein [Tritonibacter horizontis]KUP92263.1 cellulose synthase catalytic subunit [Tritonibacter horizontis]